MERRSKPLTMPVRVDNATDRAKAGMTRANGRELYSRRAKTIIESGAVSPDSLARVAHPIGQPLEIVPERPFRHAESGRTLPFRTQYHRKPLAGAFVKLTDLDADDKPIATAYAGAAGRANFKIPGYGQRQFNVIWADGISGNKTADYVTTFSSLTFGT